MKRIHFLYRAVLFLCVLFLGAEPALAEKEAQVRFRDMAELLSVGEEARLMTRARELTQRTGYDFMLVTTADAEGKDARDYAEDYYMEYRNSLDGVIYLIDMDNREIYVATSGEMRYYLHDAKVDELLDDAYRYVKQEEYARAFEVMLDDTETALADGIEEGTYTVDEKTGEMVRYHKPKGITGTDVLIGLVVALASAGTVFGLVMGKYKMKFGTYDYSYRDNSRLELRGQRDVFLNRIVTHRHIPKNPPSSGSGTGGGPSSTVHTGSGGNSFGGGGKKF